MPLYRVFFNVQILNLNNFSSAEQNKIEFGMIIVKVLPFSYNKQQIDLLSFHEETAYKPQI